MKKPPNLNVRRCMTQTSEFQRSETVQKIWQYKRALGIFFLLSLFFSFYSVGEWFFSGFFLPISQTPYSFFIVFFIRLHSAVYRSFLAFVSRRRFSFLPWNFVDYSKMFRGYQALNARADDFHRNNTRWGWGRQRQWIRIKKKHTLIVLILLVHDIYF